MLRWSADAEVKDVMAGIGSSTLKGFGEKKVREFFAGVRGAIVRATQGPAHM